MTDAELTKYLGFKPEDDQMKVARFIAELSPERRALYDRMYEVDLWTAGVGPKPRGRDRLQTQSSPLRLGREVMAFSAARSTASRNISP